MKVLNKIDATPETFVKVAGTPVKYQIELTEDETTLVRYVLGRTSSSDRDQWHAGWGKLGSQIFDAFCDLSGYRQGVR